MGKRKYINKRKENKMLIKKVEKVEEEESIKVETELTESQKIHLEKMEKADK